MVSEFKIDMSFPTSQFAIQGFSAPFQVFQGFSGLSH